MRQFMLLSAMVCCFTAAPAFAQTYPAVAVIVQQNVEVHSGPGKLFYATSKLNMNDKVTVLRESKEQLGWLEIIPPPGSFSWVNAKYFKQIDARQAVVIENPSAVVEVRPGSVLVNKEPDRVSANLTPGTIVILVDRPLTVNGMTWLPIQPRENEVRFIPVEAVKGGTTVTPANGRATWTPTPEGYTTNPYLAAAEKAENAKDLATARKYYLYVANNATDTNQKRIAQDKLAALPVNPSTPVQATTTSLSPANKTTAAPLIQTTPPAWSVYGKLGATTLLSEDGQPVYTLNDLKTGQALAYVTTNSSKSLQTYINRTIAVYGPTMYRPDSAVRMQFIVATHVATP